ncbi:MAG: glycosyltransferase family 2 protein [Chitinophagaceae bacterium]|jgi:glycosyltransferase involved in cell wall biosynthesis
MEVNHLWVVMPVYNEEEAVGGVIDEWQTALLSSGVKYTFCILNDGSKDDTLQILENYATKYPQIKIVNKPNSGHGQTCVMGYQMGLETGADWIFQIDSDGQCDPQYFPALIAASQYNKAVYGQRVTRDDGLQRIIISKFVRIFTLAATGQWIIDGNVPYRLIHADLMKNIAYKIPSDFHLANILVSVLSNKQEKIKWIPIHFRDRSGGSPSVKTFSFVKHGFKLFKQLKEAIK